MLPVGEPLRSSSPSRNPRLRVGLPSEAQYERVAGWRAEAEGPLLSHKKELYPWGDDASDFSDHFSSGEVFNVGGFDHMRRQRDFQKVLTQTARFKPRGLSGLLYWAAVLPVHPFVFGGMLQNIRRLAESQTATDNAHDTLAETTVAR